MSKSQLTRNLARALRLKASWFEDPTVPCRSVSVRVTMGQLRDLREELDRAAFVLDEYANRLGRDEGAALAQVEGEQWRITERKRKRASELADALLEDRKYEIR